MDFAFTDDQLAFRDTVRALLDRECGPDVVRAAWEGKPNDVWARLSEMGVAGMTVPEEHGGLGMDELDTVLVLEEAGRAAVPEPLLEHLAVAVPALAEAGGSLAERWLPALASGEAVATAGIGVAPLVASADRAALVVDDHDQCLHAIECTACDLTAHVAVDQGRRVFSVAWSADRESKLEGADFARAFDRAALAASAQLVGLAARLIDMSVDYAGERRQFGRPVGSFQAVQHRLADALLRLELARPVVYRAAYAVVHDETDRARHVSSGKAYATDAAAFAARAALQVHGAIGYSWEHDLHLYMKRAWALAAAWGDEAWHRRRVGDWLLGTRGASGEDRGGPGRDG